MKLNKDGFREIFLACLDCGTPFGFRKIQGELYRDMTGEIFFDSWPVLLDPKTFPSKTQYSYSCLDCKSQWSFFIDMPSTNIKTYKHELEHKEPRNEPANLL